MMMPHPFTPLPQSVSRNSCAVVFIYRHSLPRESAPPISSSPSSKVNSFTSISPISPVVVNRAPLWGNGVFRGIAIKKRIEQHCPAAATENTLKSPLTNIVSPLRLHCGFGEILYTIHDANASVPGEDSSTVSTLVDFLFIYSYIPIQTHSSRFGCYPHLRGRTRPGRICRPQHTGETATTSPIISFSHTATPSFEFNIGTFPHRNTLGGLLKPFALRSGKKICGFQFAIRLRHNIPQLAHRGSRARMSSL